MKVPDRSLETISPYQWRAKKVLHKPSGEIREIKDVRFNPEIHEDIEEGNVVSDLFNPSTLSIDEAVKKVEQTFVELEDEKPFVNADGKRFKTEAAMKAYATKQSKLNEPGAVS
jgi:hypothetical protein